jgi:hypothetical protein
MSTYSQANGHYDFNRTPWHPLTHAYLHMRIQIIVPIGTLMPLMDTTWVQCWITTGVAKSTSQNHVEPG